MLNLFPSLLFFASIAWAVSVPQPITLRHRITPRYGKRYDPVDTNANASEPLQEQFNGTDLQWFGEVGFGSPPQNFLVVFDTGSFTVEVPGVQCGDACANQHKFDPTKSSTFVTTNITGNLNFGTGTGVDPTPSDAVLNALEVMETMTLLDLSVPNTTLLLITNQTQEFALDESDGIFGLGYRPPNTPGIFAALKQKGLPALFSLFLTPRKIGHAEITLGGIDSSKLGGQEPVWAPINLPTDTRNFWSLNATQLVVNDHAVNQDLLAGQEMVFDSGTSNIVMPTNLTTAMYALISPDIKPFGTLGAFGIPCNEISKIPSVITFTFRSSSGSPFNLTIPSEELSVGPFIADPNTCQTLINALDIGGKGIIGASLLKHYYSIWDVDNASLGFVPNAF